jgi:polyisoprenoid-binding protein YceI
MMYKTLLFLCFTLLPGSGLLAQKYFTRAGKVSFYSDAPLEKIEAHNRQATAVVDFSSGAIEFAVLIKAFQFEKALMQEHFNENYLESTKYPKATFKGQVLKPEQVKLDQDGRYPVKVKGKLTIKGVTREVETEGGFVVHQGALSAVAAFKVAVADYEIGIPKLVADKIAKVVEVKVDTGLAPLGR